MKKKFSILVMSAFSLMVIMLSCIFLASCTNEEFEEMECEYTLTRSIFDRSDEILIKGKTIGNKECMFVSENNDTINSPVNLRVEYYGNNNNANTIIIERYETNKFTNMMIDKNRMVIREDRGGAIYYHAELNAYTDSICYRGGMSGRFY